MVTKKQLRVARKIVHTGTYMICRNNQNNSGTGRKTQDQLGQAGKGGTRNIRPDR
jgi:hypothetical protein